MKKDNKEKTYTIEEIRKGFIKVIANPKDYNENIKDEMQISLLLSGMVILDLFEKYLEKEGE